MNKSKLSEFTLVETKRNIKYTVELSANDYLTRDGKYINAIVLFKKDVLVDIKDLEITRKYDCINGLAGRFPMQLYAYLETAWFVSAIEEDYCVHLSSDDFVLNDSFTEVVHPTDNDQLSWGVDWIDAERVWGGTEDATNVLLDHPAGQNIKIGIIDSGIDYTHPDLDNNYVGGIDYVNDDSDPYDDCGHGTHVAGIVGAEDNDIVSVIGVAPKVSLYGIKVLNSGGSGSASDTIAGINWAVNNKMDIINLSLGNLFGSSTLKEAINRAWDTGIVVVAAAGNNGPWVLAPAKYDKSIAVANLAPVPSSTNPTSVTHNEGSNTGSSLDVSAPGTYIISDWPSNSYYNGTGTSMASPMVAGTCALILSVDTRFSPEDVRQILISTASDLGATGHDNKYGYGQINAWQATKKASVTPPSDSDNDGLYDREEMQLGTDYLDSDSDNDGLSDGYEVHTYGTDPLDPDTDYDTLTDGQEHSYGTNPFSPDTDNDDMNDGWEVRNGLNPLVNDANLDPDGDGLTNHEEYYEGTDPQDWDTDDDGYSDGFELNPQPPYDPTPSDPTDPLSVPTIGGLFK
ncbi:MAG: S8 family peptidase [Candidatus Heimdallarchaeaceae archaeon]